MDLIQLSNRLLQVLNRQSLTIATAESCTGGNVAHNITLIPGSSSAMMGGVIAYNNAVKMKILGVKPDDLATHGAVSRQVVEQMATGVCAVTGAEVGIATSGIAGPTGATAGKPVGTVWMAVHTPMETVSKVMKFDGNRSEIIELATAEAILLCTQLIEQFHTFSVKRYSNFLD